MSNKFEQLLDLIVNEEHEKANELFHEIVVEKSREIYENLIAEEEEEEEAKESITSEEEEEEEEGTNESFATEEEEEETPIPQLAPEHQIEPKNTNNIENDEKSKYENEPAFASLSDREDYKEFLSIIH